MPLLSTYLVTIEYQRRRLVLMLSSSFSVSKCSFPLNSIASRGSFAPSTTSKWIDTASPEISSIW